MAYQALGLGTTANDGTGDSLRTGGDKVNDNFVEVYTKLGDGTTLTADTVTLLTASQTLTNKTLTSPTITGTGAIAGVFTGNITGNVTGNIDGIVGGTTPAAVTGTAISGTSIAVTGTGGAMTLNTVTTGERNALSAAVGMIIYNSTTSKIEAYAGSAWVALH